LLKTEAKPKEPYHNRSVHTLVKMAKTTIRMATMTNVGRMALRRRPARILLKLISPRPLLHHSSSRERPSWSERFRGAAAPAHVSVCARSADGLESQVCMLQKRVHQQRGSIAVSPLPFRACTALMASLSVEVLIRVIVVLTPSRSRQLLAGTKKAVAPASSAAEIFS
jgi:hypothetical protein